MGPNERSHKLGQRTLTIYCFQAKIDDLNDTRNFAGFSFFGAHDKDNTFSGTFCKRVTSVITIRTVAFECDSLKTNSKTMEKDLELFKYRIKSVC